MLWSLVNDSSQKRKCECLLDIGKGTQFCSLYEIWTLKSKEFPLFPTRHSCKCQKVWKPTVWSRLWGNRCSQRQLVECKLVESLWRTIWQFCHMSFVPAILGIELLDLPTQWGRSGILIVFLLWKMRLNIFVHVCWQFLFAESL